MLQFNLASTQTHSQWWSPGSLEMGQKTKSRGNSSCWSQPRCIILLRTATKFIYEEQFTDYVYLAIVFFLRFYKYPTLLMITFILFTCLHKLCIFWNKVIHSSWNSFVHSSRLAGLQALGSASPVLGLHIDAVIPIFSMNARTWTQITHRAFFPALLLLFLTSLLAHSLHAIKFIFCKQKTLSLYSLPSSHASLKCIH